MEEYKKRFFLNITFHKGILENKAFHACGMQEAL